MYNARVHTPRFSLATAGAVAGALALASSATAATVLPADVSALPRGGAVEEYGSLKLVLSSAAKSRLTRAGAKVTVSGGKLKGSTITFTPQDAGSAIDVTTMKGAVPAQGSLSIKGPKGTAKLTAITFEPGVEKDITAKLGKKLLQLGTLTGGKASFGRTSDGTLKNAKVSLSAKAVKAINAKTGGGLAAGAFGTATLDVTGRELPIKNGVATMTLDPAFAKLITDNGFALGAEPPATVAGNVITIQITGGAFDPEGLTGRLAMEGKVTIGRPDRNVGLFGWRAVVSKTQNDLYANINDAIAAPIAALNVTNLDSTFDGPAFVSKGAVVTLSKISVSVLKQQFGLDLPVGTPLGTVDLTGTLFGT